MLDGAAQGEDTTFETHLGVVRTEFVSRRDKFKTLLASEGRPPAFHASALQAKEQNPMQTRLKILSILPVFLILMAFVLRAVVPPTIYVPGGWPLGSHWYRAGWVAFWFFLITGIVVGLILVIKGEWRIGFSE